MVFCGRLCRKGQPSASRDSRWLQPCQAASIQRCCRRRCFVLFFLCCTGNHPPIPRPSTIELYTQPQHTLHQRLVTELLGNRLNYSFYCSIQPGSCSLSQNSGTPKHEPLPSVVPVPARHRVMNYLCNLPSGSAAPAANMD